MSALSPGRGNGGVAGIHPSRATLSRTRLKRSAGADGIECAAHNQVAKGPMTGSDQPELAPPTLGSTEIIDSNLASALHRDANTAIQIPIEDRNESLVRLDP
jgi:hypothetical protein